MATVVVSLSPLAREAVFLRDVAGLSDGDIARATGAAASTARAWLVGTRTPSGLRAERLVELSALVERLVRVMDPSYIAIWLRKPIPALGDDKPLDVIAGGEYRRVAQLIAALEESPSTQVRVEKLALAGAWWRQVPRLGDPLYRADPPVDGRWQHGGVVGAMYFADSEGTAWAEWYRALAESAIPPDRQMPRDLWRWNVEVDGVADLSTPEKLAGVGLVPPRPSRATWPPFQEVGEKLWSLGYRGVICPSAARPEHRTLCVFRESDEIPGAQPVRPAVTVRWAPAPPPGMTT